MYIHIYVSPQLAKRKIRSGPQVFKAPRAIRENHYDTDLPLPF